MDTQVIVALISGICVAIPTIIATILSNSAHDKVVDEKIKNLSAEVTSLKEQVKDLNKIIERILVVERDLKSAWVRIDELKESRHDS